MARYHLGFTTPAAAANAALVDVLCNASIRARVLEIGLFNTAATAATLTLERTTAIGTRTTPVNPVPGDTGDGTPATANVATAWSVQPTFSGTAMRRYQLAAVIGAGVVWTFGMGDLVVPLSGSLAVVNRGGAATGVLAGHIVIDE